jgi:hypothetical protein
MRNFLFSLLCVKQKEFSVDLNKQCKSRWRAPLGTLPCWAEITRLCKTGKQSSKSVLGQVGAAHIALLQGRLVEGGWGIAQKSGLERRAKEQRAHTWLVHAVEVKEGKSKVVNYTNKRLARSGSVVFGSPLTRRQARLVWLTRSGKLWRPEGWSISA